MRVQNDAVMELTDAPTLPRVDAATAHALKLLYGRCAPSDFTVHSKGWRLRWTAPAATMPTFESFHFRLGSHAGRLGLDAVSVAALLGERQVARLPRELRYVLLAQVLHPLADALEKASRLRFEWSLPEAGAGGAAGDGPRDRLHAAHFRVEAAEAPAHGGERIDGFVEFDEADALATVVTVLDPPAGRTGRPLAWLRLPLRFSLGSTHLNLREMRNIRPGDIVSIEEWGSSGTALLVTASAGGREFVGFGEGTRITIQQTKDIAMIRDTAALPDAGSADDADGLPLDRLDALEVTLRFEVGDLSVSLGELRAVRTGHVFDLAQPLNRSVVRIVAHGNVLGKGYLVAVGDRLGVRVAEFAPGDA